MCRRSVLAVCAGVAALLSAQVAMAQSRLRVMTWSGYELPRFHEAYDQAHPEGAAITVSGSDDEQFAKVRAGTRTDIAHPCLDRLPDWKAAGLIQPIDPSRIRDWKRLFPVLRDMPGVMSDGKVWMLPWDWANTSITYRIDLLPGHPDSWSLLWDPRLDERTAMIDEAKESWTVAAMMAHRDPFNEDRTDIEATAAMLRRQVALARLYTTDMTTLEQSLATGEIVAAMTWNSAYVELKRQNVPVAFMKPKEGMLTWVCGLVLARDTPNRDRAYDFLNAMFSKPSGTALMRTYGYGSADEDAFDAVPPAEREALALPNDPESDLKHTVLITPVRNRPLIATTYQAVKAGG